MNVMLLIKYSSTIMQGKRKLCECLTRFFLLLGSTARTCYFLKCYIFKMADPLKKMQCIEWFIETKTDTQTQRNYQMKYMDSQPLVKAFVNYMGNL